MSETASQQAGRVPVRQLAWVLAAGAVVTAALAVFGIEHTPNYSFSLFGSAGTGALSLKSKVATGILGLALLQLLLALWMYGRIPGEGARLSRYDACTG